MAIREKTISFHWPTYTSISTNNTLTSMDQITLYIPEASPVFKSCTVELGFFDNITAGGGSINPTQIEFRLGAAAYSSIGSTGSQNHTNENMAGVLAPYDFTAHFTANWTGTSMTADARFLFNQTTGTTLGMSNVTVVIHITYQYDDTASTQIKTVRIPMESEFTFLSPNVAANYGTDQIPALTGSGILPESGITIRDYVIVIEGNTSVNNTSLDWWLNANIDGGATYTFAMQEGALASDIFGRWIYKPSIPNTAQSHNLQLWTTDTTQIRMHHITVTLVVTYEFNLAGTSRVLNSIIFPFEMPSPLSNNPADPNRFRRHVLIADPGTITMRQSAYRLNWNDAQSSTSNFFSRAGAQAYRAYRHVGTATCGMYSLQQRLDAGSVQGAALTLVRGLNEITIDGYTTVSSDFQYNLNGYVLLNYESDVAPGGIGANTRTIQRWMKNTAEGNQTTAVIPSFGFDFPETNYWMVAAGYQMNIWTASNGMAITLDASYLAGEGPGAGHANIYADAYVADAERACTISWFTARTLVKRFPNDIGADRFDIKLARQYRAGITQSGYLGLQCFVTMHAMTWTVAGTISNNDPAKTTQLKLFRNNELFQEQTLGAGTTSYSFTVYDNTESYHVSAYQDDTHLGRSRPGVAT